MDKPRWFISFVLGGICYTLQDEYHAHWVLIGIGFCVVAWLLEHLRSGIRNEKVGF